MGDGTLLWSAKVTPLDWIVLLGTALLIIARGMWLTRRSTQTAEAYLRGDTAQPWATVGLAVMATQASAITFLSVPGQAYEDGMRFLQVYFGLPLAIIAISVVLVPVYYRLKVYTAYEILEARFGVRARVLGASLFLLQRGLAAGITLYAPAIILSALLGWPLEPMVWVIGGAVTLYTVSGGAAAVSQTQKQQMIVMLLGIVVAAAVVVWRLPEAVGVGDALRLAGVFGRLEALRFEFNLADRYNIWSGVLGGFFLSLAYFGTDQSQVGRYLGGRSVTESRLGLLFNGVLKIPMQAAILLVGVLVFVFYLFEPPPLHFNQALLRQAQATGAAPQLASLGQRWRMQRDQVRRDAQAAVAASHDPLTTPEQLVATQKQLLADQRAAEQTRRAAKVAIAQALPGSETKDSDYIFLTFVQRWLPPGLVGLLVAVILFAAMSSTAGELSALGTTTTLDLWKRLRSEVPSDKELLFASRAFTVLWGAVAVAFASVASLIDNLIQAVNILGSLFYGTILGLFLAALFVARITGRAVVPAAIAAQLIVLALYLATDIGFLWYNLIGCALVLVLALVLTFVIEPYRDPA